jgi:transposase
MNIPVRIGMDTSKSVFQLHGVDENEVVVVRRQFRRAEMIRYFERHPPVLVAIESCGSSHHWARLLQSFGHEVKLIPPQYVKAYVKRGKNDAADAEFDVARWIVVLCALLRCVDEVQSAIKADGRSPEGSEIIGGSHSQILY